MSQQVPDINRGTPPPFFPRTAGYRNADFVFGPLPTFGYRTKQSESTRDQCCARPCDVAAQSSVRSRTLIGGEPRSVVIPIGGRQMPNDLQRAVSGQYLVVSDAVVIAGEMEGDASGADA